MANKIKSEKKPTKPKQQPFIDILFSYLKEHYEKGKIIPRNIQISRELKVSDRTVGRKLTELAEQKLIKYKKARILKIKIKGCFVKVNQTRKTATVALLDKQKLYEFLCEKAPNIPTRYKLADIFEVNVKMIYYTLKELKQDGLIRFCGNVRNTIVVINQKQHEDSTSEDASASEDFAIKDEKYNNDDAAYDPESEEYSLNGSTQDSSAIKSDPEDFEGSNSDSISSKKKPDIPNVDIPQEDNIESHMMELNEDLSETPRIGDMMDLRETLTTENIPNEPLINPFNTNNTSNTNHKPKGDLSKLISDDTPSIDFNEIFNATNAQVISSMIANTKNPTSPIQIHKEQFDALNVLAHLANTLIFSPSLRRPIIKLIDRTSLQNQENLEPAHTYPLQVKGSSIGI